MKNKSALYAGSFDPFTLGHQAVVEKALTQYENIYIGVGHNPDKKPLFSVDERVKLIKKVFENHPSSDKIHIISYTQSTVDLAISLKEPLLIRGIRHREDLIYEQSIAEANKTIAKIRGVKLETDFIIINNEFLKTVSSRAVKTLCNMGEYIAAQRYVAPITHNALMTKYLKDTFSKLFENTSINHTSNKWNYIVKEYSRRAYHNLSHLGYMINMLNIYKQFNNDETLNFFEKEVLMAIFLHDIVYKSNKPHGDNEMASAQVIDLWSKDLKQNLQINAIKSLILSTTHKETSLKGCHALIADLDFAILACPYKNMWKNYEKGIRKEFSSFSDEEYKMGRINFLKDILNRKQIFHTPFFFDMLEQKARENINNQLKLF